MDEDDLESFSEIMQPTLNYDINRVPEPLKPVVMEALIGMNTWLMDTIEKEGILLEMLTWSQDRITKYEEALISKHKAEHGDD
jgi:hypothetical protein